MCPPSPAPAFIALALPPVTPVHKKQEIKVELRNGALSMTMTWPLSAAADLASWTAALAVTGNVDAQGARVHQYRLGTLAVAVIGRSTFGSGLARRVAQVVAHHRAQRTFKNRLFELLEESFKLGWRHRPGDELLQQLG
jgi:hypothetical protein